MNRAPRLASVVALLGAEVGALLVLGRLGRVAGFALPRHGLETWARHAPTEDLFAVAARLGALGLTWWLLAATVLSITRRVVPGWQRLRALDSFTPPALRHLLDRALVLGVGVSLGLAGLHPAGAATRPRVDTPVLRGPVVRGPVVRPSPSAPRPTPRGQPSAPRVVIVRAGDNLWVIAARALTQHAPPTTAEIAPYWRRVVAENTPGLRSHDPDLIFPGERIVLPPVP
jgi:nucleoid-associated protein YgaU